MSWWEQFLSPWAQEVVRKLLSPQLYIAWLQQHYNENPVHFAIEVAFLLFILYLLNRKEYVPKRTKLTVKEEDALIAEWHPEPLCPPLAPELKEEKLFIVESGTDATVTLDGGKQVTNWASSNFIGLANTDEVKKNCRAAIEKYGVGSCGPRGFYGTIDVHLQLEEKIAKFLDCQESILYSDGIACVASVIPAFAKKGDLIICDTGVHFGIQQGITLSRSNVLFFKHNDMTELKRILEDVKEKEMKSGSSKKIRKFIVVEGLSQYYGDVAPLKTLVALKNEYKYRLIVDDSMAFGVLGRTGRGTYEHFELPVTDIDIMCGTLDHSMGSVGGWCVGNSKVVVDHQRLSGLGYCFSASAPPYTSVATMTSLQALQRHPDLGVRCTKQSQKLRRALKTYLGEMGVLVVGDDISPIVHLRFARSLDDKKLLDLQLFKSVAKQMAANGIIVTVPKYVPAEKTMPAPSIRLYCTIAHTDAMIEATAKMLKDCIRKAMEDLLSKVERSVRSRALEQLIHAAYEQQRMSLAASPSPPSLGRPLLSSGAEEKKRTGSTSSRGPASSPSFPRTPSSLELSEIKERMRDTVNITDSPEYQQIAWLKPIVDRSRTQQEVKDEAEKQRLVDEAEQKMEQRRAPYRKKFKDPYTGGAIQIGSEVWTYGGDGSIRNKKGQTWFFDAFTDGMIIKHDADDNLDDLAFAVYDVSNNSVQLRSFQAKLQHGQSLTKVWDVYEYSPSTSAKDKNSQTFTQVISKEGDKDKDDAEDDSSDSSEVDRKSKGGVVKWKYTPEALTAEGKDQTKVQIIGSVPPLVALFCAIVGPQSAAIAKWKTAVRDFNDQCDREYARRRAIEAKLPTSCPLCSSSSRLDTCCNCGFFCCKNDTCEGKPFPGQCPLCQDEGYRSAELSEKWMEQLKAKLKL
jgi:serine palmitoyltransferase